MNTISLGFTGTQKGMTPDQKEMVRRYLYQISKITKKFFAHHGDCIGADKNFHDIVSEINDSCIIIHPPKNPIKRAFCKGNELKEEKEYLDRNKDIINECDMLIATPGEYTERLRSGTWSTIRKARKAKKDIIIIFPNGNVINEEGDYLSEHLDGNNKGI